MSDLATQLRTIAEQAKALRDAGVSGTVRVGEVEFTLEPSAPVQASGAGDPKQQGEPVSAFDDPTTYGLAEGSVVPGLPKPQGAQS